MTNLRSLQTPELDRLQGFLDAAQHIFIKGALDVTLQVSLFEILDGGITDEDVVLAAYPKGFNPIEYRNECSIEEMTADVHELLTIARRFWKPRYSTADIIERELRQKYWQHVMACFDFSGARIVSLGHHVPWVNILGGFAYILYAADMSRCLLLVGNTSD